MFSLVIDDLIRHIQDEITWRILFVDDIVLINETRAWINYKREL